MLGLIAEPDRLRVVAALALGASTRDDIMRLTALPPRAVEKALARLVAGDLVDVSQRIYRLQTEEILRTAREAAAARTTEAKPGDVVARFMRNGRLTRIPATRSKRLIVLDHVAQSFEPGRRYRERDVNDVLRSFHEDVASLRRYLVDDGFMSREAGVYWRSGGTFTVW